MFANSVRLPMKLLVLGSGGREHALAWKLHESQRMEEWLWADKTLESPRIEEQLSGRPQIECWEACLNEEDSIFIPVGWWHSVRGVGLASSINASVSVMLL